MGIGTFGAFTQARLAIYAAQTGLSVTGNNISNINTPGYTRQRLSQTSLNVAGSDRYYAPGDVRTGQGVLVRGISQIRNPYLDIRFREENAKVGYMNAQLEGLNSIAQVLDEVGKGVDEDEGFGIVALEISNLITALQNLTKETGHQEYDNIVRQVASNLVSRLNSYANRLEEVRQNTITDFGQDVDRVNSLLTSIRSYNEEIRKCEIHGDAALELRDERNNMLDELSGLIDISVTYSEETISAGLTVEKLTIRLGNANPDPSVTSDESLLVDGVYCAQLGRPMQNPYYGMEEDAKEWAELRDRLENEVKAQLREDLINERPDLDAESPDFEQALQDKIDSEFDGLFQTKLNEYLNYQYWSHETDGPVAAPDKASVVVGGADNDNFDLMITELTNKAGEVLKTIQKGLQLPVDGDADITDSEGNVLGTVAEMLGMAKSYRTEMLDKETGDTIITIYRKALDAAGNPILIDGKMTYTKQVYRQVDSKPVFLDDNDLGGEVQAERELLTEKGEFIDMSVIKGGVDENAASKRGVQYYQSALDLLANQLAKVLNEANQGFLMDPDGNYITGETYINENGKEVSKLVELASGTVLGKNTDFSKLSLADRKEIMTAVNMPVMGFNDPDVTDEQLEANIKGYLDSLERETGLTGEDILTAYLRGQFFDGTSGERGAFVDPGENIDDPQILNHPKGIFVGGNLFSNGKDSNDDTNITASNISISQKWQTSHILVQDFTCPVGESKPASGASENIRHMLYLLDTQKWDFNANQLESASNALDGPMFNGTIYEFWNNVGSTLGKDQNYTNTELTAAYETALSVDTNRASVSSVDFNDEAMNLMMYSKSYNAACRLMTTIDSMIDKLINNTGMTT